MNNKLYYFHNIFYVHILKFLTYFHSLWIICFNTYCKIYMQHLFSILVCLKMFQLLHFWEKNLQDTEFQVGGFFFNTLNISLHSFLIWFCGEVRCCFYLCSSIGKVYFLWLLPIYLFIHFLFWVWLCYVYVLLDLLFCFLWFYVLAFLLLGVLWGS